jgi:RHS repeat-associated protein
VFGEFPNESNYILNYKYRTDKPHALANINQTVTTKMNEYRDYQYSYDKNGNMAGYTWGDQYRDMLWDEENRLQAVNDGGYISMYTYDDSDERVIKSSGGTESMFVNGANIGSFGHEKNYTAYLNPYFVFKEGSFTKHYYIGAQRIVSKIGNGRFDNNSGLDGNGITAGSINFAKQQSWYDKKVEEYIASLGIPPGPPDKKGIYGSPEYTGQPYPDFGSPLNENNEPPLGWPKVPVFNQPGDVPGPPIKWGDPVTNDNVEAGWGYEGTGVIEETDLYFYHPDHLGSTSYVTTRLGKVSQHVEYIPFGEVFLEEKNDKWNSPYKFNAKEFDEETGLGYFGARYYDSKISQWYSVDPLAEKYPSVSPYIYTLNNPINLIDPDGREPVQSFAGTSSDFRNLLINISSRKVGNYTGAQASNYMRNLGNTKFEKGKIVPSETGFFNTKKGRYIYTDKGGWMDMSHFMFYAGRAYNYKLQKEEAQKIMSSPWFMLVQGPGRAIITRQATMDPVAEAIQDGYHQERLDAIGFATHSAFSYEDLPTDREGARFGAEYFDPFGSKLNLADQVGEYLDNILGATSPQNAPNSLPPFDNPNKPPTRTNHTTTPVYTKQNP